MEPELGFEPGSAGYKATALTFELSSIDYKDHCNPGLFLHVAHYFNILSNGVVHLDRLSGAQYCMSRLLKSHT